MKALVIGCGKFGVRVSEYLAWKNHDVVVVDSNSESFLALSKEFTGRTLCGVGYDKDILEQAGIATVDVVISFRFTMVSDRHTWNCATLNFPIIIMSWPGLFLTG